MSENDKKDRIKTVTSQVEMKVFMPNEDGLTSRFTTVQDWLLNICETEQPKEPIDEYRIKLIKSEDDYTVYLSGVNTFEEGKNNFVTRIEFEPEEMYFPLPKNEFENRTYEQVKEWITGELKNFTKTEKFTQSFFVKANAIITVFNGEAIWSKDK